MSAKSKKTSQRKNKAYSRSEYEAPVGKVTQVDDFLPSPDVLFAVDDKVKITIEIEGETLDFFKNEAQKKGSKYQRLIRQVLKQYAKKYSA
ncbi:CopG family transcriptional regulator [Bdellovibrio sp. HCB209]|uniref:CopG family transcriptional regulator n=1 Tax=Bdellovibrio sp. HCB209 TaxID=3394354 RepID=UPI0039B5227E